MDDLPLIGTEGTDQTGRG